MQMHSTEERNKEMQSQKEQGVISKDPNHQNFSNSGSGSTLAAPFWAVSVQCCWVRQQHPLMVLCFWCCALPKCRTHLLPSKLLSCTGTFSLFLLSLFPEHFDKSIFWKPQGFQATLWSVGIDLFQLHLWFFICSVCPDLLYLISLPLALFRIIQCKVGKENAGFI